MGSTHEGSRTAFEAIGVTLIQSLERINSASLASLQVAGAFYQNHLSSREDDGVGSGLFDDIGEENIYFLLLDRRRYILLAAIGLLDSFLSDAIRFFLLVKPTEIETALNHNKKTLKELERKLPALEDRVENIVRRRLQHWEKRLVFLQESFGLEDGQLCKEGLRPLIDLRNGIAHHGGLYDFQRDSDNSVVFAQARQTPEVTDRQCSEAIMLVTQATDAILVCMAQDLFGDMPRVRPMTSALQAHYKREKRRWLNEDSQPIEVERINNPGWRFTIQQVQQDQRLRCVDERTLTLRVSPTGVDAVPALFSVLVKQRHGIDPKVTVDEGPIRSLYGESAELIHEMKHGRRIDVEIHEARSERPRVISIDLAGFRKAWERASQTTDEAPKEA